MDGGMGVVAWDRARGWARTRGKPIPPQLPCPHLPLLNGGVGLAVVLLLLVLPVQALAFPWWPQQGRGQPTSELVATSPLQEVAPSAAVQQLRQALDEHIPRLEILSPKSGSVLPAGPWTLRLQLEDWPLVDAGPLGLGPHLVVQLDEEEPIRLTSLEATMPPLSPGSHRLTVFAARPWGEAVKNPGAFRQIRLHRAAANPLALPLEGTPQLIPVSPMGGHKEQPILLDWLLIDAPLQNLHSEGSGWRLRVTVNNDSFLVARQSPLWLEGWKTGANSVLLELVDPKGDPLNPPFNSVVTEVTMDSMADQAPWQGYELSAETRAILLGKQSIEVGGFSVDPTDEPTVDPQVLASEELLKNTLPAAPLLSTHDLEGRKVSPETPADQVPKNEQSPGLENKPFVVRHPSNSVQSFPPQSGDATEGTATNKVEDEGDLPDEEFLAAGREATAFENPNRNTEKMDEEQWASKMGDSDFRDIEHPLVSEPGDIPADPIRAPGSSAQPRQGRKS